MAERLATVLFVVLALVALSQPALAAPPIFVGNGTAASCTETALGDALVIAVTVGGATIKFHCGGGPVTIELTATLVIPDNTTIDGGGTITLFAAANVEVALVTADTTATLKRVIISGDRQCVCFEPQRGGVHNHGTLTIDETTFSANQIDITGAPTNFGTATVKNSAFDSNFGSPAGVHGAGSALLNLGTLSVRHTTFTNQVYDTLGGALLNGGTATIHNSTFIGNVLFGPGLDGSAITNFGTLAIKNSFFSNNLGATFGGAIQSFGALTIENSTFIANHADFGGAIYAGGTLTLIKSTVSGNTAFDQGGGIFNLGTLTLSNSSITENTADVGGGIYHNGALVTLHHTSVTGNTPDDIFP
jgi:predicted outer membrane repeat protein